MPFFYIVLSTPFSKKFIAFITKKEYSLEVTGYTDTERNHLMWRDNLLKELEKIEGAEAARHFDTVLLPQIFADFVKVLNAGGTREEYKVENGVTLTLSGRKPAVVTEVYLNGRKVYRSHFSSTGTDTVAIHTPLFLSAQICYHTQHE